MRLLELLLHDLDRGWEYNASAVCLQHAALEQDARSFAAFVQHMCGVWDIDDTLCISVFKWWIGSGWQALDSIDLSNFNLFV